MRLGAFTWNLLDEHAIDFRLQAMEFDGTCLSAGRSSGPATPSRAGTSLPRLCPRGLVLKEEVLRVEEAVLDHKTPSLAFALQETLRINVCRRALDELGLIAGPWLDEARRAVRAGLSDSHPIAVPGSGALPLGLLRERILCLGPGQRVAYVIDAADTAANRARIVALAAGADDLFIESPFLDRDLAATHAHLTARAAGEIARAAQARRVTGFHYWARHADEPEAFAAELDAVLAGGQSQSRTEQP